MCEQLIQQIDMFRKEFPHLSGYLDWIVGDIEISEKDVIASTFSAELGKEYCLHVLHEYEGARNHVPSYLGVMSEMSNVRADVETMDAIIYALKQNL